MRRITIGLLLFGLVGATGRYVQSMPPPQRGTAPEELDAGAQLTTEDNAPREGDVSEADADGNYSEPQAAPDVPEGMPRGYAAEGLPAEGRAVPPPYQEPARQAAFAAPARITYLHGAVYIKGVDDRDWSQVDLNVPVSAGDSLSADSDGRAEVELPSGVTLRMASGARVDVTALAPTIQLKGLVGAFNVKVPATYERSVDVEAPGASLDLQRGSYLRVDISDDGYTRYTVSQGEANVAGPQGPTRVTAGSRFYVQPGELPSDVERTSETSRDDFDDWSRQRDERRDYSRSPSYSYVGSGDVRGAADLDDNGSWVEVDHHRYYRPKVRVGWRPYSNGYWIQQQPYGYVWISYDPFGYTTHHYGRWFFRADNGWLWQPGIVWAPHCAYFTTYGNNVFWAPLDPWGHPVYMGRPDYQLGGGVFVDFRSWSSMPTRGFMAGSRLVAAVHRDMWKGPISMTVVANPHERFKSVLHTRTPFVNVGGVRVSQRIAVVESKARHMPAPGLHLAAGKPHVKSQPAAVKFHGRDPATPFQVHLKDKPRVGGPANQPPHGVKAPNFEPRVKPQQGKAQTEPRVKPQQGKAQTEPRMKPQQGKAQTEPRMQQQKGKPQTEPRMQPKPRPQAQQQKQPRQQPPVMAPKGVGKAQPQGGKPQVEAPKGKGKKRPGTDVGVKKEKGGSVN